MDSIPISEFKTNCLRLLDTIKRNRKPITVTKNGEPLVIIYPAPGKNRRAPFGAMKGSGRIIGDIVEPTNEGVEQV